MKVKHLAILLFMGLPISNAFANTACAILMDGFKADGKKSVYDLNSSDKKKYEDCVSKMKLLPNSYKSFEEESEKEARKRDQQYKAKVRSEKEEAEVKEIRKTRQEYTFSAKELEDMFNKPIFAYRFSARINFADKMEGIHHKVEKLTDLGELCKEIGKLHDIKGMKAKDGKLDTELSHDEIERLTNKGVIIPDSFFTTYELFETSKKQIQKMKDDGSRALKILEFKEVTCVSNDNKKDEFDDLNPKITLHTKTKDIVFEAEEDDYIIDDNLGVGERRRPDVVNPTDDDLSDIQRDTVDDEVARILRLSSGSSPSSRKEKSVIVR